MTKLALKKQIIQKIDSSQNEKLLKAIYAILQESEMDYELTDAQKKELDRRIALHKSGKSKSYTLAEVKMRMAKRLAKK